MSTPTRTACQPSSEPFTKPPFFPSLLGLVATTLAICPAAHAADYQITVNASQLIIADTVGNGDVLDVSQPNPGEIAFASSGRSFSINGASDTAGSSGNISSDGLDIVINAAGGADTINLGAFANLNSDLTINGGTGDDTVNLNGSLGFVSGNELDLELQDDEANPGIDSINVAAGAQIDLPGNGDILMTCSRNITVGSGALLRTESGQVLLEANLQNPAATGSFNGVRIYGTVRSDNNSVVVKGRGGDGSGGYQLGVEVHGVIESLSTGSVTVEGIGGASTNLVTRGVTVSGSSGRIRTVNGPLIVTGDGGTNSNAFGIGVTLLSGAKIESSGSGPVTVNGNGAGSVSSGSNFGIEVGGSGSAIVTASGPLELNGFGGANNSVGLRFVTSAQISSSSSDINLSTNRLDIDATSSITTAATTTIQASAFFDSLDVGGSGGIGLLGINDAMLDRIFAETIVLDSQDGFLNMNSPISPANTTNIVLQSNGGISAFSASPDITVSGTLQLDSSSEINFEVNGPTPDSDYQPLGVVGTVDLNNASIFLGNGYLATAGTTLVLIDNDSSDPILGTFGGTPEGTFLDWPGSSSLKARITYTGGDGNDVAITLVEPLIVANATDGGAGSLRDALVFSKQNPGIDTIIFDPAFFSGSNPPIIQLSDTTGQLLIDHAVTIDASSIPEGVIIDGGSNGDFVLDAAETRCLLIADGDDNNDLPVTLRNLTIRNGVYSGANAGANIHNREDLTLENCLITGGRAFGFDADGGGIYGDIGALTLNACTVSDNQCSGNDADGGGIFSSGQNLTITASSITANQSIGSASEGGGVWHNFGTASISTSTISGNQASGASGGGIHLFTNFSNQTTTLTNCTISGNSAGTFGGGVYNINRQSKFIHCTITENSAPAYSGGGIASYGDSNTITEVTGSIIRNNSGNDVDFVDGTTNSFDSNGANLVGTGNALGNFMHTTDETGETNPILLAPLGNYGGPTATRPPLPGSPAIDGPTITAAQPAEDQRGAPRNIGTPDIGAVEAQPAIVLNDDDSGPGSLRDTILFASPGMTVTFDEFVFCSVPVPVISLATELLIDKALTIDAANIPDKVIISGNSNGDFVLDPGETRCFLITDGDDNDALPVLLKNLIIRDGVYDGSDAGANIHNREALTLENCQITGGRAFGTNAHGGGIYSLNGTLTIIFSTVSGNWTSGTRADGGGIFSLSAPLTVSASTISGNQASSGGGIYANTNLSGVTASLTNCTIHGNTSNSRGGGYYNVNGLSQLTHCTITGNTAATDSGSGIASWGDSATQTELTACIVRDNSGGDVQFVNGPSTNSFNSLGSNMVGDGNATSKFNQSGDQVTGVGVLVNLTALGNYGGPTLTRLPLPGSPVINAAPASSEMFDQRDLPRTGTRDIGAVETSQIVVTTTADENDYFYTLPDFSLREAISISSPGDTIHFDDKVFPATITLTNGALTIDKPLTIDASAIEKGVTVSGNNTSRIFTIDSATGPTVTIDSLHLRDGAVTGASFPNNVGGNIFINSGETLNLKNSTISNGSATSFGGGIAVYGTLSAENSTIAENSAGQFGGAILSDGSTTLNHCTVSNNTSSGSTGGVRLSASGSLTLRNSIVANNTPGDVSGSLSSTGVSIIENHTSGSVSGTVLAIAPLLAPLGSYANGTPGMPPLPGSPTMEGGVFFGGLTPLTDQLHRPRPSGPLPDIGAVEALPLAMLGLVDTDGDEIPDILEGPGGPYPHLTVGGLGDSTVDTDGDGSSDADEIGNMTDLYDANDRFRILSFTPASGFHPVNNPKFDITFNSFPGLTYKIESSQSLSSFFGPAHSTHTATGFTTTETIFTLPNFDFVRVRRD